MADTGVLISVAELRRQAIYFYIVPVAWCLFLLLLPAIFAFNRWAGVVSMVFPGLWLFTWLGYLMHECWHKYVPNINNRLWYTINSLLILTDPQVYSIIHGTHHSGVHTWGDIEFHPFGNVKSRTLRIVVSLAEIGFGVAFMMVAGSLAVPRDKRFSGKYRWWKLSLSLVMWCMVYGGVGFLSHVLFRVDPAGIIVPYALMIWLGSFVLHQSQLIEHGNLIVDGDYHRRNARSRNLRPAGIAEKVFLFLTHNDSREHVLHHTLTKVYSRPFPDAVPLPPDAWVISFADYARILLRMISGDVDRESADAPVADGRH